MNHPEESEARSAFTTEARPAGTRGGAEDAPHFADEPDPDGDRAWEEIDTGRFMPRRIRGSYRGRALG